MEKSGPSYPAAQLCLAFQPSLPEGIRGQVSYLEQAVSTLGNLSTDEVTWELPNTQQKKYYCVALSFNLGVICYADINSQNTTKLIAKDSKWKDITLK